MAKKIFQNYDFAGNQIIDFRAENLGANPTAAKAGRIFFNTSTSVLALDTGSAIKPLLTEVAWDDILSKPSTFAPSAHTHPQSEITNLVSDLALLAPLASPSFTGNPTAPTQTAGNSTTRIATTAFVQAAVAAAGGGDMVKTTYDTNDDGKVDAADTADAVPWSGITSKPTTISGFGITDAGALATRDTVGTAQIDNNAVTLAKMAQVSTSRILGRVTASTGNVEALTATQVKAMLSIAISDVTGLQTALDNKAASSHTHTASDVTDFATAVNAQIVAYWDSIAGTDANVDTIREVLDLVLQNASDITSQIGRHNADIGDGTSTSIAVTHNLNSLDVSVEVYDKASGDTVGVGVTRTNANVVTIEAIPAPALNELRVVIKK
uniref:Tail repeat-like protein n=1 Tax=Dinoroseobacter phage vB_DshS_R26L TaxID=3161158 RepID=A0AAU7VGM1_9CAUD